MDLATFRASLRSVLGRDVSDMAIALAVDELTQELTILEMEKRLSLASASGEIATPADFHRVMKLTRNSDGGFASSVERVRLPMSAVSIHTSREPAKVSVEMSLNTAVARRVPLRPPALVPVITSMTGVVRVRSRSRR